MPRMTLRDASMWMGALTSSNTGLPGAFRAAPRVAVGRRSSVVASSAAQARTPCQKAADARANHLPATIIASLDRQCAASGGAPPPRRAVGRQSIPGPVAPSEQAALPEPVAAPPASPVLAPGGAPSAVASSGADYGAYEAPDDSSDESGSGSRDPLIRRASYDGSMATAPPDGIPKWAAIAAIAGVLVVGGVLLHRGGHL